MVGHFCPCLHLPYLFFLWSRVSFPSARTALLEALRYCPAAAAAAPRSRCPAGAATRAAAPKSSRCLEQAQAPRTGSNRAGRPCCAAPPAAGRAAPSHPPLPCTPDPEVRLMIDFVQSVIRIVWKAATNPPILRQMGVNGEGEADERDEVGAKLSNRVEKRAADFVK